MQTLIVTAADDNFFPLLHDLLSSLNQWQERPFTDIAVFDLGLSPGRKDWLARVARYIVEPRWDLPVNDAVRATRPSNRALTVRPFLPRYFPGYDIYIWMDADTWVQERFAIERYVAAAADGHLAAVPHSHTAYRHPLELVQWRRRSIRDYFGQEAVERGLWHAYVNAGVFALRADAPHWALWAKWFRTGLENTFGKQCCDQSALNHTVWTEHLPVTLLPALCNWLCHLAVPRFDPARARFCEPDGEARSIGILHLLGKTKNFTTDTGTAGALGPRGLRYPGAATDL